MIIAFLVSFQSRSNPIPAHTRIWVIIVVKITNTYQESISSNQYIVAVSDQLSKWLYVTFIFNNHVKSLMGQITDYITFLYRCMDTLISDQDSEFVNQIRASRDESF